MSMNNKLNCFMDGNALCVVKPDFVTLGESEVVFVTLTKKQRQEIEKLNEQ